ncbi:hypothetical protein CLF_101558 [Clonorchis sinensis]|uniref:Uncharacterized protein n=1 Tax=Clonorchis sinensis TaxID=79923 RepID=G7Y613_CLOSI|nr:hypothetical protein CLF_101558 [Clonorchis sinensis]
MRPIDGMVHFVWHCQCAYNLGRQCPTCSVARPCDTLVQISAVTLRHYSTDKWDSFWYTDEEATYVHNSNELSTNSSDQIVQQNEEKFSCEMRSSGVTRFGRNIINVCPFNMRPIDGMVHLVQISAVTLRHYSTDKWDSFWYTVFLVTLSRDMFHLISLECGLLNDPFEFAEICTESLINDLHILTTHFSRPRENIISPSGLTSCLRLRSSLYERWLGDRFPAIRFKHVCPHLTRSHYRKTEKRIEPNIKRSCRERSLVERRQSSRL